MSRMKYIRKNGIKDPGSAITHGIAFLLAAVGAAPLLIRSSEWSDHIHIVALDRKSTRLNSSHMPKSRMPSSA